MAQNLTVCVCGGGNGAHVMAGVAASRPGTESRVLTLFQDEAERWTNILKDNDFVVRVTKPDGQIEELKSKPALITNDASKAVPGAELIIFIVPAFAHEEYFSAIAPYVQPNAAIIGLPGQPGFEFQCLAILGDVARQCAILSYDSLPWAARISEFGKKVEIIGTKVGLIGSKLTGKSQLKFDPQEALQSLLGEHPVLSLVNNYIEITLQTIIHPPILFTKWKDWDGKPVNEKPLFYQGLDEEAAECLSKISDETVETGRAINRQAPQLRQDNVEHILDWYRRVYSEQIKDASTLLSAMRTNAAYNGLTHPMKQVGEGQWVPDFSYRYLSEDVPYGLVVIKGLAELAGVPTPEHDRVLKWCEEKLGKVYLVGSELKGPDVKTSRAPQAFGFNSVNDLVDLL